VVLGLAAWAGLLGATAAQAQGPLVAGTAFEHVLQVDGKQVLLPEGSWVVAADAAADWTDPTVGSFGYLRTLLLFRVADGRVDTVLEINTNVLPTTDGWGMAAACGRTDLILAVIRYRAGWDGSCYFVTHTVLADKPTPAWRSASEFAVRQAWSMPRIWLTAGFRAADRSDVLDIRYHFNPEARGFAFEPERNWGDSQWMANKLDNDPRRRDFARAVNDWAPGYSALVDAGLKNRLLGDETVAMPQTVGPAPPPDEKARRLSELEALQRTGTITRDEYAAQAAALMKHADGSSSGIPDINAITATKAISYRIIVSISHIFVDYYWTGNFVAAGALEILQITINSAKFYFHELAWAKYMGLPRGDGARTIDFPYIGVNQ
jgi:uncharacterized membrane protein